MAGREERVFDLSFRFSKDYSTISTIRCFDFSLILLFARFHPLIGSHFSRFYLLNNNQSLVFPFSFRDLL